MSTSPADYKRPFIDPTEHKTNKSTPLILPAEAEGILDNVLARADEKVQSLLDPESNPAQSKYVNPSLKITIAFDGDDDHSSMSNAKIEPSINVTGIKSLADIEVVKAVIERVRNAY